MCSSAFSRAKPNTSAKDERNVTHQIDRIVVHDHVPRHVVQDGLLRFAARPFRGLRRRDHAARNPGPSCLALARRQSSVISIHCATPVSPSPSPGFEENIGRRQQGRRDMKSSGSHRKNRAKMA